MSSSTWTQKSGLVYLAVFLCLTCAAATAVMGYVSYQTRGPIQAARGKKVAEGLKVVLPPFDNDPLATVREVKSTDGQAVKIYTATKDGRVTGYAVETKSTNGYGGDIQGLIGFLPDLSVRTFLITSHNETPGLGSKVTDRVRQRTIFDVIRRTPVDPSLPPNKVLDQFAGKKAESDTPWSVKKDGGDIDFVSGATISSRAAADLAYRAARTLMTDKSLQVMTEGK